MEGSAVWKPNGRWNDAMVARKLNSFSRGCFDGRCCYKHVFPRMLRRLVLIQKRFYIYVGHAADGCNDAGHAAGGYSDSSRIWAKIAEE